MEIAGEMWYNVGKSACVCGRGALCPIKNTTAALLQKGANTAALHTQPYNVFIVIDNPQAAVDRRLPVTADVRDGALYAGCLASVKKFNFIGFCFHVGFKLSPHCISPPSLVKLCKTAALNSGSRPKSR